MTTQRSIPKFKSRGLVLTSAFLARFILLDGFPRTFGGDDAVAALSTREILEGRLPPPFSVLTVALGSHPALFFYAQAAPMWLLGDGVAGSRVLSAVLGMATVLAVFVVGRSWFGPRAGLAAAAVLAPC